MGDLDSSGRGVLRVAEREDEVVGVLRLVDVGKGVDGHLLRKIGILAHHGSSGGEVLGTNSLQCANQTLCLLSGHSHRLSPEYIRRGAHVPHREDVVMDG